MSRWARLLGGLFGALAVLLGALSFTSFEIRKEVLIDTPPERVWAVIVDFPSYAQWNTQLAWLGGTAGPGEVLKLKLSAEGADPYEFAPTVSHWEPNVRFAWLARTGLPRVFDGEHFFELEPVAGGKTKLINRETYSGVLSMVMERQPMMAGAAPGFEKMNAEYKARAERR
ncbi:MAG: SRPBCC domain-containing protein [Myxococcales bacterium]|nr:SRPBCC domain-containing protein [Myxococcales bacterium]